MTRNRGLQTHLRHDTKPQLVRVSYVPVSASYIRKTIMTDPPREPHDDRYSSNDSAHHQMTDRLYEERSLMAVYEQTVEPIQNNLGTRPQEVEPTSALMRRYHR
jgi:hypothetical protein